MVRMLAAWVVLVVTGCGRQESPPPTKAEVWAAVQPLAARYRLDPLFIYALVAAESNFDPRAQNGEARGLMQIKPIAWKQVSFMPYEPNVWDWRTNLTKGVDYLAYTRSYLRKKGEFSYPKMLAAYHYGPDYLEDRAFDLRRVPIPDNDIYKELWRGNLKPVPPPGPSARPPETTGKK
jgi:soluble lytic murein transglycosylase-like protein